MMNIISESNIYKDKDCCHMIKEIKLVCMCVYTKKNVRSSPPWNFLTTMDAGQYFPKKINCQILSKYSSFQI